MKRIHSKHLKIRGERSWPEVLGLDPRDPDIVRAKAADRAATTSRATTPDYARETDNPMS